MIFLRSSMGSLKNVWRSIRLRGLDFVTTLTLTHFAPVRTVIPLFRLLATFQGPSFFVLAIVPPKIRKWPNCHLLNHRNVVETILVSLARKHGPPEDTFAAVPLIRLLSLHTPHRSLGYRSLPLSLVVFSKCKNTTLEKWKIQTISTPKHWLKLTLPAGFRRCIWHRCIRQPNAKLFLQSLRIFV